MTSWLSCTGTAVTRPDALAVGRQVLQRRELRLAARAPVIDHHLARGLGGDLRAQVGLDHGQRQVDAGGDAGRGPDRAALDEDAVVFHPQAGIQQIADFAMLLEYVHEIPGIERIRYTTSHPKEMTQRMVDAYARLPKLVSFLHLPVQAGSDRVLAAMKRGYTTLEFKSVVRHGGGPQDRTQMKAFMQSFCRNKGGVMGLIVLAMVTLVAISASWIFPDSPWDIINGPFMPPLSDGALLGTDTLGRDIATCSTPRPAPEPARAASRRHGFRSTCR
ncbi:hypothetical protein [Lactiplantibacillus plantarum]|uniref:hypothetical protein n=1 Tax=Lactiplantibacillus plantarum TaxID=1590 RepID=UPI004045DFFE